MRIIGLLTDYGLEDNFVGVMKGVILGVSPLAIFGSFGYLEIAVREGSAEDYFHARVGDIVKVN